jgi:hypothetical protein
LFVFFMITVRDATVTGRKRQCGVAALVTAMEMLLHR